MTTKTKTKTSNRNGNSKLPGEHSFNTVNTQERVTLTEKVESLADVIIEGIPSTDSSAASILTVNMFSEKAREQMRLKQCGMKVNSKKDKDPVQCMKDSLYRFPEVVETPIGNTIFGVPAAGLKHATVRAFKAMDGYTMVDARGQFFVNGMWDETETTEIVPVVAPPITGLNYKEKLLAKLIYEISEDEMLDLLSVEHKYGACLREDDVRVGNGTADIRYRGAFSDWKIPFTITYNQEEISLKVLWEALDRAGRSVGICENRPEKSGAGWGRFQVSA